MKNNSTSQTLYSPFHPKISHPTEKVNLYTPIKTRKIRIYSFLFGILGFLLSYYYGQYWVLGDQGSYISFYENVKIFNIQEGLRFYRSVLGASEPVYFFIVYMVSPYIDKLVFFSFMNFLLAYFTAVSILKLNVKKWILLLFILNFYLVVLYTGAERLKVAATFMIMGLNMKNNKLKILLLITAVLSHFQIALLIPAIFSNRIAEIIKNGIYIFLSKRIFLYVLILILFIGLFFLYKEAITRKIIGRVDQYMGWQNLIKPGLLYVLTIIIHRGNFLNISISFFPTIVLAYYVGDFRITILAYFISVYFLMQINRGVNMGVVIPAIYFFYRGVVFLESIKIFGYGQF